MYRKEAIEELFPEVLDGTELRLAIDSYRVEENLETGEAKIHCDVHHERTGDKNAIDGTGVGIVDALFHGLTTLYSDEFPSLTTIEFSDFVIAANLDTGRDKARTDSTAKVTLRVKNSEGHEYSFEDESPSMTRSSLNVVLRAAEFFINAERSFIAVYRALQHAKEQNRSDSVQRYTRQLTTLVEATSYSEVIDQMKQELEQQIEA